MNLKRIHHVAYRCKDAKETVEFYQRVLNMEFTVAFAEDQVPSTKEPDPYMHVFLDCGMSNVLAFFEFIQRKQDEGFGEGNFKALFESIERDQIARGVIEAKA